MKNMKASDFRPGDKVLYLPTHARGDEGHEDCERGVVTSTNTQLVFVRYKDRVQSQGTYPASLRILKNQET